MEEHNWLTISAATLEEAELIGIARLGALREEVEIQIVDEGKKGFLGFGSRPVVIRIRRLVPLMSSAAASSGQVPGTPQVEEAASPSVMAELATVSAATRCEEPSAPVGDEAAFSTPHRGTQPAPAGDEAQQRRARPAPAGDQAPRRKARPVSAGDETQQHKAHPAPADNKASQRQAQPTPSGGETTKPSRRRKKKSTREEAPRRDAEKALLTLAEQAEALPTMDEPVSELDRIILEEAQHLLAGFKVQMSLSVPQDDPKTRVLSLRGRDARSLVGRDAHIMEAVQYLLRLLVERRAPNAPELVVDADGYWERHDRKLRELARRVADEVARTGRPVRLRPMPARDRRVIHVTLRDDARVSTESHGSGVQRAVVVSPKGKG